MAKAANTLRAHQKINLQAGDAFKPGPCTARFSPWLGRAVAQATPLLGPVPGKRLLSKFPTGQPNSPKGRSLQRAPATQAIFKNASN